LIAALALVNAPTAPAQSKGQRADDLLARLSYSTPAGFHAATQ
jgi:hypothetical protein